MNPSNIPVVKNVIRSLRYKDCRKIVEAAMEKPTAQEIEEYIIESVALKLPEGLVTRSQ
jgi:phosphotransferase system enzyme I (PtsI)